MIYQAHIGGPLWLTLLALPVLLAAAPVGVKELPIGAKAPDFKLIGTDDKTHALMEVAGPSGTLVIFTCNHCPYAVAYQDRIIAVTREFGPKGVGVVAINPNDAVKYPDDSLEKMKTRAKEKAFNFPYLCDETQEVARQYGPMVTPHIFLFDSTMTLVYRGRIDNSAKEPEVKQQELRDALVALTSGGPISVRETTAFGCSIKWKEGAAKPQKS